MTTEEYNPYTQEELDLWHNVTGPKHIGWVVDKIVGYAKAYYLYELTFLEIGCSTGALAQKVDEHVKLKSALLIDIIPEVIDYAKVIFEGRPFYYEAVGLSNYVNDAENVMLPVPDPTCGLNLGGANIRQSTEPTARLLPVTTFDLLWKERYQDFKPDVIKIDAERQDINVLLGMREFLENLEHKPLIIFEMAGANLSDDERNEIEQDLKFLLDMGYYPYVYPDELIPKKSCDIVLACKQTIEYLLNN